MMTSQKLRPFGTTIFSEMTRLAVEHEAVNLSQGFPDFEGPPWMVDAVIDALRSGQNQYARSMGRLELVLALAAQYRRLYGLEFDAEREVVVFSGCTEGLMSSLLGLLDPGDEVILFEPFYDSYPAGIAMAGATARCLPLRFPDFALDVDALAALMSDRTKLIVLNTPHNPSGKVFSRAELEAIAEFCRRHDVLVLADEVYEHLTFDDAEHVPIATLPGMRERTLTLSSAGKTFSYTGWKIGWGVGPAPLVAAAQAAHQFVTFCAPPPLQLAVARALTDCGPAYYTTFRAEYAERRDFLVAALREVGFEVSAPAGTYFVLADFTPVFDGDDVAFARHLVSAHRVAAIPPSAFYRAAPEEGRRLVRFAFCKKMETLALAADRLRGLRRKGGPR